MATANKHKKRSSRSYAHRDNFERFFVSNVQKIRARNMFVNAMYNILKNSKTEQEEE